MQFRRSIRNVSAGVSCRRTTIQTLHRIRNDGYRDTSAADSVRNGTGGIGTPLWKARREPLREPVIFSMCIILVHNKWRAINRLLKNTNNMPHVTATSRRCLRMPSLRRILATVPRWKPPDRDSNSVKSSRRKRKKAASGNDSCLIPQIKFSRFDI